MVISGIVIPIYLISFIATLATFFIGLGGAVCAIKRNTTRINKVEDKQDKESALLHEMNGKMDGMNKRIDTVISLMKKNGNGK